MPRRGLGARCSKRGAVNDDDETMKMKEAPKREEMRIELRGRLAEVCAGVDKTLMFGEG